MKFLAVLAILSLVAAPAMADEKPKIDDDVKRSTLKAYEYLASRQNNDGSWGDPSYPNSTAITGFALLAFMSQGNLPTEGKYAREVAKGIRFLLAAQREDGYLVGARGGKMYDHGMATLALSQAWGMTGDEDVKAALKKATNLIVKCQCKDNSINHGGWRYDPVPNGADISVTIMQVMALRGAKDSGIHVPDETMKRALSYINSCYDERTGGYCYMPRQGPGFARTAAGICVLKLVGKYEEKIDRSVEFLKQSMQNPREHFWYGHYYACHAFHQVGGKDWEDYYKFIKKKFLEMQMPDGSWSRRDGQSAGPVYQTSIAIIALSVPANYLPIFQR
jgi:prenyltransferase beta subunit